MRFNLDRMSLAGDIGEMSHDRLYRNKAMPGYRLGREYPWRCPPRSPAGSALRAFRASRSFEEGCLLAVNLGDDADTTGAIFGQLAGAYYGERGIPASWLEVLAHREMIGRCVEDLMHIGREEYDRTTS